MTTTSGDQWFAGDAYDAYMGRWSRRLARAFVDWLHPSPSANWLELGCGTGALTSTICAVCAPASIVACDPSEPFVAHARAHLSDSRASFIVAGSDALPHRDNGFDMAVSGLVFNFLPDPVVALASIRERLRRGGTVAAYVWDYASGMQRWIPPIVSRCGSASNADYVREATWAFRFGLARGRCMASRSDCSRGRTAASARGSGPGTSPLWVPAFACRFG